MAPVVIGTSALLLVACGASDAISPSVSTPSPDVEPNACSLLSDGDIASAFTPPPSTSSPAPTGGQTITHLYSVTQVNEGGTKTAGQCVWRNDQGAQVIALVIPKAELTKLADYTTGAQQAGGAYIQEGNGRGFVAVQDGPGVVAITLVLSGEPSLRTSRLADLARAAVSGAKIPQITAGPSSAASATPAGPAAGGPGQVVQGQGASAKVQETDQLKFNPTSSSVKVGQVVEWDNSGSVAHNVTFDEYQSITSDTMNSGDKYQVKFTKAGTYSYHCTFHPGREGQITVQ
jgi:plastocyanin